MKPFILKHGVRTYETNADGRMSVSNLIHVMQEAAGAHADQLGWSVRSLRDGGKTWILQRFYVQIESLPEDLTEISVKTFPSGADRLFAYRDYLVTDDEKNIIAKGTSSWVILDLSSRRVQAPPEDVHAVAKKFGPRILEIPKERMVSPENFDYERTFHVRKHDLDLNNHVNNVRYVEWAVETVPESVFDHKQLCSLDIVFKAECFFGDEIRSVSKSASENSEFSHTLTRSSDEKIVCMAKTVWGK